MTESIYRAARIRFIGALQVIEGIGNMTWGEGFPSLPLKFMAWEMNKTNKAYTTEMYIGKDHSG